MSFIKDLFNYFSPNDFEGDDYGWLTNQLAHNIAGYILTTFVFSCIYIFNNNTSILNTSLIIGVFWVVWEIRHLVISKNWKDFIEDLFFELSGVTLFYFVFSEISKECQIKLIALNIIITIVTSFLFYKRSK